MIIIITSRDESAEIGTAAANDLTPVAVASTAESLCGGPQSSPRLYTTDVLAASWTTVLTVVQYRSDRLHRIRVESRSAGASVRRVTIIYLLRSALLRDDYCADAQWRIAMRLRRAADVRYPIVTMLTVFSLLSFS